MLLLRSWVPIHRVHKQLERKSRIWNVKSKQFVVRNESNNLWFGTRAVYDVPVVVWDKKLPPAEERIQSIAARSVDLRSQDSLPCRPREDPIQRWYFIEQPECAASGTAAPCSAPKPKGSMLRTGIALRASTKARGKWARDPTQVTARGWRWWLKLGEGGATAEFTCGACQRTGPRSRARGDGTMAAGEG